MKHVLVIAAALILVVGATYIFLVENSLTLAPEGPNTNEASGAPTFTWSYKDSEDNDIPYTEINITATYENSVTETKFIDRVEGSCNTYENTDADMYERSSMIICYYAGLGRYFKVVQDKEAYLVQRKIFEEASPDYNPPMQSYETVVRF